MGTQTFLIAHPPAQWVVVVAELMDLVGFGGPASEVGVCGEDTSGRSPEPPNSRQPFFSTTVLNWGICGRIFSSPHQGDIHRVCESFLPTLLLPSFPLSLLSICLSSGRLEPCSFVCIWETLRNPTTPSTRKQLPKPADPNQGEEFKHIKVEPLSLLLRSSVFCFLGF